MLPQHPRPHQSRATAAGRTHLLASPAHITSTAMLGSRRCRLRRLTTMYRTGKPSQAEQPAAIRCKPSRPMMPMPQAPSFDAVPRRTNGCQATLAAAVRCKQQQPTEHLNTESQTASNSPRNATKFHNNILLHRSNHPRAKTPQHPPEMNTEESGGKKNEFYTYITPQHSEVRGSEKVLEYKLQSLYFYLQCTT